MEKKIIYNDKFKNMLINLRLFEQFEVEIEKQINQETNIFILGILTDTETNIMSGCKIIVNENKELCILLEKDSTMKNPNYKKIGWLCYVANTPGEKFAQEMDKYYD